MDAKYAEAFLNKGIRALGKEVVLDYLLNFCVCYSEFRIVSVGCGMCAIEAMHVAAASELSDDDEDRENLVKQEWICVDPNPSSYKYSVNDGDNQHLLPFMKVEYKYVKDLVAARPEIVGKCALFLNWCDPNQSDYDMEAVELLRPVGILSIIERFFGNGAAGGERFHNLYEFACKERHTAQNQVACGYRLRHETGLVGGLDVRICWLGSVSDENASGARTNARQICIKLAKFPSTVPCQTQNRDPCAMQ